MKTIKHNLIAVLLLCTTIVFGQKQEQKYSESFSVNRDVIVEVNTSFTDVTIEEWDRNEVSISGVLEIDGVTKEEATEYFDGWNLESLGNKSKIVITSQPNNYFEHSVVFDTMDFNFEFDSITFNGSLFEGDYHTIIPPIMDFVLDSSFINFPEMPAIVIGHLAEVEFDHEAYEKDKEKYMEEYEKKMEVWEKEFEEKFEPQMKEYEEKMEVWAKEYEEKMQPQIEAYEKKMEKWEKEFEEKFEPQMKEYEKKMEKYGKKMEEQAEKMEKKMEEKHAKSMKLKKRIVIKVPKDAVVKLNVHHGELSRPDNN